MRVRCSICGRKSDLTPEWWRCDCGAPWEPAHLPRLDPQKIRTGAYSLWRYGEFLGLDIDRPVQPMGVGWTPLVPVNLFGRRVHLKLEYLSPSGSFKDRGVCVMAQQLHYMGVTTVVEDSSGNAGASLAAHAARLGLRAQIFVPAYASPGKKAQIAVYGADVVSVEGPRIAAGKAAQEAIGPRTAYASHAYHPAYLVGQMTAAWELWEQLGRKSPDWIFLPAAQGGQFLGYWFGFKRLVMAGLAEKLPRLVAVQPARIAPIVNAVAGGLDHIPSLEASGPTVAEGAAVPRPVRDWRILEALSETGGQALAMDEEEIMAARDVMAQLGYFIEPTSALGPAGFQQLMDAVDPEDMVVLPLTGTGLKGVPQGVQHPE
jgi:threonine synthase